MELTCPSESDATGGQRTPTWRYGGKEISTNSGKYTVSSNTLRVNSITLADRGNSCHMWPSDCLLDSIP